MAPRMRTAGTMGIIAGLAGLLGFVLSTTSGFVPDGTADPARAIACVKANLSLLRITIAPFLVSIGTAAIFVAGLADKLRARTPTRAAAALYLTLLGLGGYGIGALLFWRSMPMIAAMSDQVAASHVWSAVSAVNAAAGGFGGLFTGLVTLFAGWAIVESKVLNSALGYFGLLTGVVLVLTILVTSSELLMLGTSVLPGVWFIWAGSALRWAV